MKTGFLFDSGTVYTHKFIMQNINSDFNAHSLFKGVYVKNLVTGKDTENIVSCHLVKVEPFCSLETHCHINNLEIQDVIYGSGTVINGEVTASYTPGTTSVISEKTDHSVTAGEDGLYILAKFIPALF